MAKHSYERARWDRREARRRVSIGGWWVRAFRNAPTDNRDIQRQQVVQATRKAINGSIHKRMSEVAGRSHRFWRQQAHHIERLHALGGHDAADDLDPQPRRLGIMWDIW